MKTIVASTNLCILHMWNWCSGLGWMHCTQDAVHVSTNLGMFLVSILLKNWGPCISVFLHGLWTTEMVLLNPWTSILGVYCAAWPEVIITNFWWHCEASILVSSTSKLKKILSESIYNLKVKQNGWCKMASYSCDGYLLMQHNLVPMVPCGGEGCYICIWN